MNKQILQEDVQLFAEQFELSEQLRGKTFLITGATGLIGSVMVKCLVELNRKKNIGIHIIAVIRNAEKAKEVFSDEYSLIDFRLLELQEITKRSIGDSIDYIVHLASPTASKYFVEHPVETLQTAIYGTNAVLEYAKVAKVEAMVYASSLEVYGSNLTDDWIKEDFQGYVNPTEVRSSYNMSKRACECLCHSYAMEYDVPVMVARLTQTFGAGISEKENRVFAQFARSVVNDTDITLCTEGASAKPYCYTTDAVNAILYLLIEGKKGEAYNVANESSYISIRDMAYLVKDNFNPDIDVIITPKENQGYAPETKLRLDTSKLESLGWRARFGLKKMFEKLVESMR